MWTDNFRETEWLRSSTAERAGITLRWASEAHRAAALRLTVDVLEPLRARVGRPVLITSGYRTEALTEALRASGYSASRTSDHMTGRAADIVVPGLTHEEVAAHLHQMGERGEITYDQLIWYQPGAGGSCHVSHRGASDRMQAMVATPAGLRPWSPAPAPRSGLRIGELEGARGDRVCRS